MEGVRGGENCYLAFSAIFFFQLDKATLRNFRAVRPKCHPNRKTIDRDNRRGTIRNHPRSRRNNLRQRRNVWKAKQCLFWHSLCCDRFPLCVCVSVCLWVCLCVCMQLRARSMATDDCAIYLLSSNSLVVLKLFIAFFSSVEIIKFQLYRKCWMVFIIVVSFLFFLWSFLAFNFFTFRFLSWLSLILLQSMTNKENYELAFSRSLVCFNNEEETVVGSRCRLRMSWVGTITECLRTNW